MYDYANNNNRKATRLYQEFFSDRQQSSHKIFVLLYERLAETGIIARNNTITDRERP